MTTLLTINIKNGGANDIFAHDPYQKHQKKNEHLKNMETND